MTIRNRLEDARVLSANGRQEGAFVSVLIAAAATSRKRYSRAEWDDSEAFKNFIYDEMGIITGCAKYGVVFPFQGKQVPLEDIFYHHMRCQLVHEGGMPESIVFTQPVFSEGGVIHTMHLGEDQLGFPAGWIEHLATAVWLAVENDDLWPDDVEQRHKDLESYGRLQRDGLYCRRPSARRKKPAKPTTPS